MSEELAKKYKYRGYTAPSFLRDAIFKILNILFRRTPKNPPDLKGKRIALLNLGGIGDLSFTIPILNKTCGNYLYHCTRFRDFV